MWTRLTELPIHPTNPNSSRRRARWRIATSSSGSWVTTTTWAPGGSSSTTPAGSATVRTTGRAGPGPGHPIRASESISGLASTIHSSMGSIRRIWARARPTWPIPKMATHGRRVRRGSRSTVTSPPQTWTSGGPGTRGTVRSSGVKVRPSSIARPRSTAVFSRFPPPMLPHVSRTVRTILLPTSRGACPTQSSPRRARSVSCSSSMAQNTASGVAGAPSGTIPPRPKAATASRSASRTEMASMRGGSPTALLP